MRVTVYSCLFTSAECMTALGIIRYLRYRKTLRRRMGAFILAVSYLLCILRLLLPIDFTFSKGIFSGGFYADFLYYLEAKWIVLGLLRISVWDICCVAAAGVAVIKLLQLFLQLHKDSQMADRLGEYDRDQIARVNEKLCAVLPRFPVAAVKKSSYLHIPYATGIFRKTVVLPETGYTDEQLYYILLHEHVHHLQHDLYFKALIQVGECIFWWLPFHKFLCRDLEELLELRCDAYVRKLVGDRCVADYLQVLTDSVKKSCQAPYPYPPLSSVSWHTQKGNVLIERFTVLTDTERHTISEYALLLSVHLVFAGSYLILPTPQYAPPREEVEEDGAVESTPENTCVLFDGTHYAAVMEGYSMLKISREGALLMIESGFQMKEVDCIEEG